MVTHRLLKDEAVESVLSGIQSLIALGASATARHAYCPSHDPDADSDAMSEGRQQVEALRKMRQEFENLMLAGGMLRP